MKKTNLSQILRQTESNNVYCLMKPLLRDSDENDSMFTFHGKTKIFDQDKQDFIEKHICTLNGVNFLHTFKEDSHLNGKLYKAGQEIFLNINGNKMNSLDIDNVNISNDCEMIDYYDFKREEQSIENTKNLHVDLFKVRLESDYIKEVNKLKQRSSIGMNIKIGTN